MALIPTSRSITDHGTDYRWQGTPDEDGIPLWNSAGRPASGNLTSDVGLWNAGTEANQKPGVGPDQAPYQSGADTGAGGPDDTVRPAEDTFGNLPETSLVLPVTITPVP